ncbi:MAG: LptE family protein [Bacteroidales bacterium]|jgi:hypothetical protein|nr:LptE family protein [Bacteroidales bacterium]
MKYISILLISLLIYSCSVNYSLSGKSISPDVKTFSVGYITNQAQQIVPTLSDDFTEELKEKFRSQAGLQLVQRDGDLEFAGKIVTYNVSYSGVTANQEAAQNRLTITIEIDFINNKDISKKFTKKFTATRDFAARGGNIEEALIPEMIDELVSEIFMDSVASW